MPNMTAVEIVAPGGPDVLKVTQRPVPFPVQGEVVIKLAYSGVNRPDMLQRAGLYNPPVGASDLPGLEGAGVISAVGLGVTQWSVGMRSVHCCLAEVMPSMRQPVLHIACQYHRVFL